MFDPSKHPDQYKFSDEFQKSARAGAEYWYGDIWKNVGKCVFCDLKDRYIIKEVEKVVLTTNLYPYIDGHLMIIPRRHITHLKDLTQKEWETIRMLSYIAKKMLRKMFGYKGMWLLYREGGLGAKSEKTVEHLHIHVMPYKDGLVEWNYDTIKYAPFDVAHGFKKNDAEIERLMNRYKKKYGK